MDPLTLALAMVAGMSELLPLLGCTNANGLLHAAHQFIVHIHAASDCHVEIDVDARSPHQSPLREKTPVNAHSSTIALSSAGAGTAAAATAGAAPGAAAGPAAIARFAESPP